MNIYSDPHFYDLEYDVRKDDISFYIERCKTLKSASKPLSVLELGCGTGRISVPLAKEGFKVTGVDIDEKMLNLAKQKANGLEIELVASDFIELKLDKKFDVVLMPYNAFQHIHSDQDINRFFDNLKNYMDKDSLFIMEVMNPLDDDLSRGADDFAPFDAFYVAKGQNGRLHRTEVDDPKKELLVIEDTVNYDAVTKVAHYKLYYSLGGRDLVTKEIDLRMFTTKELTDILNSHKLRVLEIYGDVQKRPLKDDSQSIVIVAGGL